MVATTESGDESGVSRVARLEGAELPDRNTPQDGSCLARSDAKQLSINKLLTPQVKDGLFLRDLTDSVEKTSPIQVYVAGDMIKGTRLEQEEVAKNKHSQNPLDTEKYRLLMAHSAMMVAQDREKRAKQERISKAFNEHTERLDKAGEKDQAKFLKGAARYYRNQWFRHYSLSQAVYKDNKEIFDQTNLVNRIRSRFKLNDPHDPPEAEYKVSPRAFEEERFTKEEGLLSWLADDYKIMRDKNLAVIRAKAPESFLDAAVFQNRRNRLNRDAARKNHNKYLDMEKQLHAKLGEEVAQAHAQAETEKHHDIAEQLKYEKKRYGQAYGHHFALLRGIDRKNQAKAKQIEANRAMLPPLPRPALLQSQQQRQSQSTPNIHLTYPKGSNG